MFGQLTSGLEVAWIKLKRDQVLTNENIMGPMCDIKRALFEADASLVIRQVVQAISDLVVRVVLFQGDILNMTGIFKAKVVDVPNHTIILELMGGLDKLVALQRLLEPYGIYKVAQTGRLMLRRMNETNFVAEFYRLMPPRSKPPKMPPELMPLELDYIIEDAVIMDIARWILINKEMVDEMQEVKKMSNPTKVLLVVNTTTGQEVALVKTFNVEIGIVGAILTKLDRGSRDDATLSDKEVFGKPIKLAGYGEHMEDLKFFYLDQMVGRLSRMGDVFSLVEKAQEVICQEDAENCKRR
ncbi:hypothetical protein F3Y22_tig00111996pilonHSYRG00127 [Hibiscus syriacus]|uniref:SRP54-type proteins GTP-binding domain-containing protein n=1 Tax=Hibiscus syriacus TaxID=106335 RepID=A0A6A2X776_HIBSY|nr:hypothetical protein F3Y22_tig00111996pilonHSYRG00127 [Hibiscus syriacus]